MRKTMALVLVILALVLAGCKKNSITGSIVAVDTVARETQAGNAVKDAAVNQADLSCRDSDNGIDTSSKGIVTAETERFYDTCLSGLLIEYYCDENNKFNRNIRCPNECYGGKCI